MDLYRPRVRPAAADDQVDASSPGLACGSMTRSDHEDLEIRRFDEVRWNHERQIRKLLDRPSLDSRREASRGLSEEPLERAHGIGRSLLEERSRLGPLLGEPVEQGDRIPSRLRPC